MVAGMKLYNLVEKFARKLTMKPGKSGIMQVPNPGEVRNTVDDILGKFIKHGVPKNSINNENDVKFIYNQIKNIEEQTLARNLKETLTPKKSADVFELTGKKIDTSKPILGGKNVELTHNEKIDWLVKNVDPNAEQTIPPRPALEAMLKDGREDLIDHFFEMHTKNLGKPKIDIDTSGLKHPGLVKKMMTDEKLKPTLVQGDLVTETITKITTMEPVAAMKEANLVIGRKGIYKNLTKEQSQKILKDTDDWIFQRDPDDLYDYNKKRPFRDDPDSEDFAQGGRSGYADGLKVYPYAAGSKRSEDLNGGYNLDQQDLTYGGTLMYDHDPFSVGIEYLKGKDKYDFKKEDTTLAKDTSDREIANLILKLELENDLKARIKGNKDNIRFDISKSFAQGGLAGLLGE